MAHTPLTSAERSQRWRKQDPRRSLLVKARYRAAKAGIPFDLVLEDIVVPPRCPVLGLVLAPAEGHAGPADGSPTLDRIVPKKGYVRGNVRVVSNKANRIKSDATLKDLVAVAYYVATNTPE